MDNFRIRTRAETTQRLSRGVEKRLSGLLSSLLPPSHPPAHFSALPPRAGVGDLGGGGRGVEGDTHPSWKELL